MEAPEALHNGQRLTSRNVVLTVLPETYIGGGQAGAIEIDERLTASELLIDVAVRDARELKALFFHLEYNPHSYGAGQLNSQHLLGSENECLALYLSNPDTGVVEYGEMLILHQENSAPGGVPGFSGDGLLCTLHLQRAPTGQQRGSAAAPLGDGARSLLEVDEISGRLSWSYRSPGDYNQNGEVAVTDLTPIGIHFNKEVPPGDDNSIEAVVDGNADGKVAVADLTAIGLNFQSRVASFNVYASLSADDLPSSNAGPNGPGTELSGNVPFGEAQGTPTAQRLSFGFSPELPKLGWFYWVRPNDAADGGGSDGTASTLASLGGKVDNVPPVALLSADPTSGEIPLTVSFDASGTVDPDGAAGDISDIVQFQWDFDGDGGTDEVTTEPLISQVYEQPGIFNATVKVTDLGGANSIDSLQLNVGNPGNTAPVAALAGDPLNGEAPLTVSFDASASSDGDGGITLVEWDLDGDGSFETNTGTNLTVSETYVSAGAFDVSVQVTDNAGASDSAAVSLNVVDEIPNQPPSASFDADLLTGNVPLTVTFNAFSADDPDGSISAFTFDFEGDGVADESFDSLPEELVHEYTDPGDFNATFTAIDNLGVSGSFSREISVQPPSNSPTASFTATPESGEKPLLVELDASASSDPNGTVVSYLWDYGDISSDDTLGTPLNSHTYESNGVFTLRLFVEDDEGNFSTAAVKTITVADPDNQPPLAELQATGTSGNRPLNVNFDASGSTDIDGAIDHFLWDFDGDGLNELDSDTDSTVQHNYVTQGTFQARVTAVDDDGASAVSNSIGITVQTGWQLVNVLGRVSPIALAACVNQVGGSDRGCIAYTSGFEEGQTENGVFFLQSQDGSGIGWQAPETAVPAGSYGNRISMIPVEANPAIAFLRNGGAPQGGLSYVRAVNSTGTAWAEPVILSANGAVDGGGGLDLSIVSSAPAVSFLKSGPKKAGFVRASDKTGSAWAGIIDVGSTGINNGEPVTPSLLIAGGIPSLICGTKFGLTGPLCHFFRALDGKGQSWDAAAVLHDSIANTGEVASAKLGTRPAVFLVHVDSGSFPAFLRANDDAGLDWPDEPVHITPEPAIATLINLDLAVFNNLPMVCYHDTLQDELRFSIALDSSGSSWGPEETVDGKGNTGALCQLVVLGNKPCIAYVDTQRERIKFAILNNP